jgi:putative phosphoribosyl transferase
MKRPMLFKDRRDAGQQLSAQLAQYKGQKDVIVLGLARGGMVVADEIADALHVPLNVIVVRKVGAPGNEELALGAVAEYGKGIFNEDLIAVLGVSLQWLEEAAAEQKHLLKQRLALYRGKTPAPELKDKIVILVDDGIATGASMRVAIQSVRQAHAKKIILAVPVAAPDPLRKIKGEVDEVICLLSPVYFGAVGSFYQSFGQTSDDEVIQILELP